MFSPVRQNRYLCCRPCRYCLKVLSTGIEGFRPSSTDVDRGMSVSTPAWSIISGYVSIFLHSDHLFDIKLCFVLFFCVFFFFVFFFFFVTG